MKSLIVILHCEKVYESISTIKTFFKINLRVCSSNE
jgi:hypothetical protein